MKQGDGRKMSDEMDGPLESNTPDSWRNTTTQERETIVGEKLEEVCTFLPGLFLREVCMTSRGVTARAGLVQ